MKINFVLPKVTASHNLSKKPSFKASMRIVSQRDIFYNQMNNLFDNFSKSSKNPLFEINNRGFIFKLSNKLFNNPNTSIKFGVTGESGSGKSTFVEILKSILHKEHDINASTIYRDNYLKDYSDKAVEYGSANNYTMSGALDSPESIDFERINADIAKLERGETVYPKKRQRSTGVVIEHDYTNPIYPSQFIFSEGIGLFTNQSYKNRQDILIYAEAPEDVIKQRWFARAESRGKTGEVAQVCYEIAKAKAQLYTTPYRKESDLVVNTEMPVSLSEKFINDFVHLINGIKKN